jgi:DNA-binding transcriptional MocR family regulator
MTKAKTPFALDDTDKPKYQRMVERLEEGIAAGQWKPGDRLPSNRELAVLFGVTIGTVSKAMSEAVRRGIVDTRVGSGTYIREQRAEDADDHLAPGRMSDLSLNVLPIPPVQELLIQAIAAHARSQGQGAARLFAHVDVPARGRHARSGATWLTSMGTPTDADELVLTNGVHHALLAAFQVLLKPGDTAVCDALCYTGFQRIANMRGVRLVGVAGDGEGMRPDSLEEALRAGARVVIANPVLQNPTATTMSTERRARIAAVCREADVRVIEDGVGAPLADAGTASLAAHIPERTLHVTGFSKTIASGFRLGYARVPAPWIDSFQQAVVSLQWLPPGYYAELLELMHADGLLERCIQAHREEAAARQRLLREFIPQVAAGIVGYHAWLPLEGERSSMELCDQMASLGVKLSAAQHFTIGADAPDGVRISLGACEGRAELRRAIGALAGALRSQSRYRATAAAPAV